MLEHILSRERDDRPVEDHVVHFGSVTWGDYQRFLKVRGERSAPRLSFLDGVLEIMTPSRSHEGIKSLIGRLVETFCLERGIDFSPYGSWTLKKRDQKAGVEPDECYLFGPAQKASLPDLAIEVIWTSGGLDKLEIYRKLGVREVWVWQRGLIGVHRLRGDAYREVAKSVALPGIDVAALAGFLNHPTTGQAIRAYRDTLRARTV